jgi:iron complex outermembrane receptor protein
LASPIPGFSPNLFADSAGNIFDTPEKSRQIEVGVRHEIIPDRLRATASVFSITKRNVQTPDPNDPTGNRSVLTGEQRSDGLEFELAGAINSAWDVTLGYAYTDARTTEDNNASQIGLPLVDAPEHHVTLWTKYRLEGLPGGWVGYGLAHASDRRSSSANADFRLPSYIRHDLAVGYADGPWSYQLNLGNVSNERVYYTHGNNIHLQPGRNARVSVSYRY